jgi:hypothetical protein
MKTAFELQRRGVEAGIPDEFVGTVSWGGGRGRPASWPSGLKCPAYLDRVGVFVLDALSIIVTSGQFL